MVLQFFPFYTVSWGGYTIPFCCNSSFLLQSEPSIVTKFDNPATLSPSATLQLHNIQNAVRRPRMEWQLWNFRFCRVSLARSGNNAAFVFHISASPNADSQPPARLKLFINLKERLISLGSVALLEIVQDSPQKGFF